MLNIHALTPALGAEITGTNLAKPIDDTLAADLVTAFLGHQVLFFRDQNLTPADLVRFARIFGRVGAYPFAKPIPNHPEVIAIIKEPEQTSVFGGLWHTDSAYLETPSMASVLYSREVPPLGGDTLFANMTLALDKLDPELRVRIEHLRAVHSSSKNDKKLRSEHLSTGSMDARAETAKEATHPIIRTHPDTGQRSLYISPAHTTLIEGMTASESGRLLDELVAHCLKDDFKCRFRWTKDTVAIWDNRCLLHYPINDYDGFRREMLRVTIDGDIPV